MRQPPSGAINPSASVPFITTSQEIPAGAINTIDYEVPGAKSGMLVVVTPETPDGLGPLVIARSAIREPGVVAISYYNTGESPAAPSEILLIECLPRG